MNSEQLKDILEFEIQPPDKKQVQVDMKSNQMQELEGFSGWQQIKKDLGGIRDGLMKALLNASTLREAQGLQGRIKNIELFIESPKKYIKQSKIYLERNLKWQQKR